MILMLVLMIMINVLLGVMLDEPQGHNSPELFTKQITCNSTQTLKCYYRPTASLQLNNKGNTKYNITVT